MYLSSKCPHCQGVIEIKLTAAPAMQAQQVKSALPDDATGLEELLESIKVDELSPNERNFVNDMRERFAKYGKTTRVTEKQLSWLRSIAEGGF